MTPSSTLCRTQEALHRRQAAASPLINVRAIAEKAAAAWAGEALRADERENRERARSSRAAAERNASTGSQPRPVTSDSDEEIEWT